MKRFFLLLLVALLTVVAGAAGAAWSAPRYAVAETATPVLNTPAFSRYFGGSLTLDPCRGVRPIEFVALPGTLFRVEGEEKDAGTTIYRVTSNDYPYPSKTGYFVDSRFVRLTEQPEERPRKLPGLAEIEERLLAAVGLPYVWGGNVREGVPYLRKLYPEGDPLAGVDCSGLLYQATDGFTPRNTSTLIGYGAPVPVAGLSPEQIARKLQPLDLIAWNGHVMIVLDNERIIQSRMGCEGGGGVVVGAKLATLRHLVQTRKPADRFPAGEAGKRAFVVRRWFSR